MCYEVEISGEIIDKVGPLKRSINKVVFDKIYKDHDKIDDSYCLCCVDFEETAKANNIECVLDVDRSLWKISKKENTCEPKPL